MKFFPRFKDDFAAIAASPERRRAEIVNIDRKARRIGLCAAFFILVMLIEVFERNSGAACWALLAAMMYGVIVHLHCDSRSLQVLDLMQKEEAKPSA
jgi:hypothetical protein